MICGKKVIALCISRTFDPENHRLIMQLNKRLREVDLALFVYQINSDLYWEETASNVETRIFELIDYDITDGIVIMDEKIKSRHVSESIIKKAGEHQIPVVVVDGRYENCTCICYDYAGGFEDVVRHVIEDHRVKRPHFMGGIPGNPFAEERLSVFKKVLEENGLPFSDDCVSYGLFWASPTIAAVRELLKRPELPDAIICANDVMAITTIQTLQQENIRVPEDVIVSGFDGIEEIGFCKPMVTSCYCNGYDMADEIMSTIMRMIEGQPIRREIKVRPKLLINASCGCRASGYSRNADFNDRFYRYQDDAFLLDTINERLQLCQSVKEASDALYSNKTKNMCLILNTFCFDVKINLSEFTQKESFQDKMLVWFDHDNHPDEFRFMNKKEILPDLEKRINNPYPLVFNAIGHMGVALGYLCCTFDTPELINYIRIPQVAMSIGGGLGGFINWQHQRYLMRQLEFMYCFDSLTGLSTRVSFTKKYEEMRKKKAETMVTVVMSDLDDLKKINDTYGHQAGDAAIAAVGKALRNSCPKDALCVRLGGDEMMAVIFGACEEEEIKRRIREYLAQEVKSLQLSFPVSTSIGVYKEVIGPETSFESLASRADEIMYEEKKAKHSRNAR